MSVEFFRHDLGDEEIAAAVDALRSTFLTTGAKNQEFEEALAAYLAVPRTVTTSSATAALHMGLVALGAGPGDEVITTPMSFIATANAILMAGATPVFVDVEPHTGLMDIDAVDAAVGPKTVGVLPVHLYGRMVPMVRLRELADRHGLFILEDAAHALEAQRDGVRPGQLGDAAAFSFYATKNITSGEGGALATTSSSVADTIRQMRNHGMSAGAVSRHGGSGYQPWDMERFGWKYNMTNFQAAMLTPQLQRADERLQRRTAIAARYLAGMRAAGISVPEPADASEVSAWHLFTVWSDPLRRDAAIEGMQAAGVGVTVNYPAIHLTHYYRERFGFHEGMFPAAERIGASTISLPLYPSLTDADADEVVATVSHVLASTD